MLTLCSEPISRKSATANDAKEDAPPKEETSKKFNASDEENKKNT